MSNIWRPDLIKLVLNQFALDPDGIHGLPHWTAVRNNGHRLAKMLPTGRVDLVVVDLFALFHDACRANDGEDPDHGSRGAQLAAAWRGVHFDCSAEQLADLMFACDRHTSGGTSTNPTIGACWDADRYDLPRVGVRPVHRFMSHGLREEMLRVQA